MTNGNRAVGRITSWSLCLVILTLAANTQADAQERLSVLRGRVVSDTSRVPVPQVEVSIPAHGLVTTSDDSGHYHLGNIPAGRQEVVIRRIGYSPDVLFLTFSGSDTLSRDIALYKVQTLEGVTVEASNLIPSFEDHRRQGLGQFLTRADLAKHENRKLSGVISQMRGVKLWPGTNGKVYLYSSRRPITSIRGGTGRRGQGFEGAPTDACYAQIYLDEVPIYRGREGEPLFDLNSILPSQIEAIEYYSGPGSTPLKYSKLNSQCGVLVIHTRRTP